MRPLGFPVLAVASGKGGVGKSTVSLNLAVAMADTGARIGLLDADVYGPDIPAMVGVTRRVPARSVALWEADATALEPLERFGIPIMSAQFLVAEDQPVAWTVPLVEMLLHRLTRGVAWGPLDRLVVDLPPGTADLQQQLARSLPVSSALIVVTPQDVAHLDAKKVLAMLARLEVPVAGGVENMSGLSCPGCGTEVEVFPRVAHDRSIWATGVERLARIPLDPAVGASAEAGRPVVRSRPDSLPATAFRALAGRLLDRPG